METISRDLLTFLLNSLWQIPLIAGVAALVCRLMRNGPASHRHAVWVAALLAAVVLPLASVRSAERVATMPFHAPSAPELPAASSAASAAHAASASSAPAGRTISYAQTTASVLLAAYLLFLAFRTARLLWAWMRTVQIRESAGLTAAPDLVRIVWDRCQRAFGVRDVELLSSPGITSPVAAGAFRRSIILPESLFAAADEELLATAIGHEMAHLARHDFAFNVCYELLQLPVAFHPATWLILRGIEETREMACDELVTHKLLDAGVYARSIVSIAARMVAVPKPGYTLGVFDGDILEQRIRRLMHAPVANLKRARLVLAAGLSALALSAIVASGISITARAQTSDLADRVQRAKTLLDNLAQNPRDAELQTQARQALLGVLSVDPANQEAMNGMMTLSIMARQPQEARQWALKMVATYPQERTAYYSVGFADWSVVYPGVMAGRAAIGMKPADANYISDVVTRRNLQTQYAAIIDEGLQMLDKTLQIDPAYGDAMAYVNLLYRMKANLADTPEESTKLTAEADTWVQKALAVKRGGMDSSPRNNSMVQAPPPPPPPPPPGQGAAPMVEGRIRIAAFVQQAKLLKQQPPVYPAEARSAGIAGTVSLSAVIAKDGTVANLSVLSGPPQLVAATIDAVRQWVYQPTLLNGNPVEVITEVNVTFSLKQ